MAAAAYTGQTPLMRVALPLPRRSVDHEAHADRFDLVDHVQVEPSRPDVVAGIGVENEYRRLTHMTAIGGRGKVLAPPARANVTLEDVAATLNGMQGRKLTARLARIDLEACQPTDMLYKEGFTEVLDGRFGAGVKLTGAGRELLVDYYARKYGADIRFGHQGLGHQDSIDPAFISYARSKPGDNVRCSQYMGHGKDSHASLLVYSRENGQEAMVWFDSIASHADYLSVGIGLTQALEKHGLNDGVNGPIKVYQQINKLQRDYQSCWVYAMKTAVTLTGHTRDEEGQVNNDFLVPGLNGSLDARSPATPLQTGSHPVWVLPEVVKTSQYLHSVFADAGAEMDSQLQGAKPGVTLRNFLEKYTYSLADNTKVLDYMRQKGERLAEVVDIEAWSQAIGRQVGKDVWTPAVASDFANAMKARVRNKLELSLDAEVENLSELHDDPAAFVWQALKIQNALKEWHEGVEAVAGELHQLDSRDFDGLEQVLGDRAELTARFEELLARSFDEHAQSQRGTPLVISKLQTQLVPQRERNAHLLARHTGLIAQERTNRGISLVESLRARVKDDLVDAVQQLPTSSHSELLAGFSEVLDQVHEATGLGSGGYARLALDGQADVELVAEEESLVHYGALLQLAVDGYHEIADTLPPVPFALPADSGPDAGTPDDESSTVNDKLNEMTEDLFRRQIDIRAEIDRREAMHANHA